MVVEAPKFNLNVRHFGDVPGVVNRYVCVYKTKPKEQILEEVLKMRGAHPKYTITTDRLPPHLGLNEASFVAGLQLPVESTLYAAKTIVSLKSGLPNGYQEQHIINRKCQDMVGGGGRSRVLVDSSSLLWKMTVREGGDLLMLKVAPIPNLIHPDCSPILLPR
ncbi:hypothetical protein J6590_101227 [Homalodisca vitripennis]|nr:hypothetical protein J6590_101227 [Homalodisca vitripennis]